MGCSSTVNLGQLKFIDSTRTSLKMNKFQLCMNVSAVFINFSAC